jgi:hypothetical protein
MSFERIKIIYEPALDFFVLAIVESDDDTEFCRSKLRTIKDTFFKNFGDKISKWKGETISFKEFENEIDEIILN